MQRVQMLLHQWQPLLLLQVQRWMAQVVVLPGPTALILPQSQV
jgi:hypothetical protein